MENLKFWGRDGTASHREIEGDDKDLSTPHTARVPRFDRLRRSPPPLLQLFLNNSSTEPLILTLRCVFLKRVSNGDAMSLSLNYLLLVVMTTLMTSSPMTSLPLIFDPAQHHLCDVTVR